MNKEIQLLDVSSIPVFNSEEEYYKWAEDFAERVENSQEKAKYSEKRVKFNNWLYFTHKSQVSYTEEDLFAAWNAGRNSLLKELKETEEKNNL